MPVQRNLSRDARTQACSTCTAYYFYQSSCFGCLYNGYASGCMHKWGLNCYILLAHHNNLTVLLGYLKVCFIRIFAWKTCHCDACIHCFLSLDHDTGWSEFDFSRWMDQHLGSWTQNPCKHFICALFCINWNSKTTEYRMVKLKKEAYKLHYKLKCIKIGKYP